MFRAGLSRPGPAWLLRFRAMTEPDDFGLSPIQTLARVGDTSRSPRHVAFWKAWTTAVTALEPRLTLRGMTSEDPSDLSATHEFESCRHVRIGCSLIEPSRGKAKAGLVVLHGYAGVPTLAEDAAAWKTAADRGLAVLIVRLRGYPGSQVDVPQLVQHAAAPAGGGGQWITHGLESPLSDSGFGSDWVFSYAAADAVNACRALRASIGGRPVFMRGESMGAALAIVAASFLSERDEIERLVLGLPSMGDWPWRLSHAPDQPGAAGGAGGLISRFLADHAAFKPDIAATLRIFDTAVHARRVGCPVMCKLSLRDDVVPAPSAAAVFNALGTSPGLKWRLVTRYGHFDGGIADARRHAHFDRIATEFLDPGIDPLSRDWDSELGARPDRARASEPEAASEIDAKPASTLFADLPVDPADIDDHLIAAYFSTGRTLDDLPYTDEFARLYRAVAGTGQSERAVFHRLHNLRKAGRLPRLGKPTTRPPQIDPADEKTLSEMIVAAVGSLGQRDQLPYSPEFDRLVESFNQRTGRSLEPHDLWRLVAKIAK